MTVAKSRTPITMTDEPEQGSRQLDRKAVWAAVSRWASGVCVVTSQGLDGEPVGVTATSFSALSVTPPLISWCLDNRSFSLAAFSAAQEFAVHILGEHQDETSTSFAKAGEDKFAHRPLDQRSPSPLLRHCLARFVCDKYDETPAGDHTMFIGHVRHVAYTDGKPLLYYRQKYGLYAVHPHHDQSLFDAWL